MQHVTKDSVLDGSVQLRQPRTGYRAGLDAVLVAAAVPVRARQTVLDVGCGVGTVGLCVLARQAACHVTGIEMDPAIAALATENGALNNHGARFQVIQGDIATRRTYPSGGYHHVVTNPPYGVDGPFTKPRDGYRARALVEETVDLHQWIQFCARRVASLGTLTLIHRADRLDDIVRSLPPIMGAIEIMPIYSKREQPATRVIVRSQKGRKTPLRLHTGLFLYDSEKNMTEQADAILRQGGRLF